MPRSIEQRVVEVKNPGPAKGSAGEGDPALSAPAPAPNRELPLNGKTDRKANKDRGAGWNGRKLVLLRALPPAIPGIMVAYSHHGKAEGY